MKEYQSSRQHYLVRVRLRSRQTRQLLHLFHENWSCCHTQMLSLCVHNESDERSSSRSLCSWKARPHLPLHQFFIVNHCFDPLVPTTTIAALDLQKRSCNCELSGDVDSGYKLAHGGMSSMSSVIMIIYINKNFCLFVFHGANIMCRSPHGLAVLKISHILTQVPSVKTMLSNFCWKCSTLYWCKHSTWWSATKRQFKSSHWLCV